MTNLMIALFGWLGRRKSASPPSNFFAASSIPMQALNRNFEDFLRLLNEQGVRYLVIGGYAVAVHGYVRATGDLDVFVELTEENIHRLLAALKEFGFDTMVVSKAVLLTRGKIVRFGVPPLRLEIMNEISGVDFTRCFSSRVTEQVGSLAIPFIDLANLIKNKQASGRPKDLADVAELTKGTSPVI